MTEASEPPAKRSKPAAGSGPGEGWASSERTLLAVHGGAGWHPESRRRPVLRVLRAAVAAALASLKERRGEPEERRLGLGAEAGMAVLESSESLNAGLGSQLSREGAAETEAGLASSAFPAFAAVGACPALRHPFAAVCRLREAQAEPSRLLCPALLAGPGVLRFLRRRGHPAETFQPSQDALKAHAKALRALEQEDQGEGPGAGDTVGTLLVGPGGGCVSGSSSGGVVLKDGGRLGPCTQLGAANWAERRAGASVAVAASGRGEPFIWAQLARAAAEQTFEALEAGAPLDRALVLWLEEQPDLRETGLLILVRSAERADLLALHNTPSFAFAFADSHAKPRARISILPPQMHFHADLVPL